MTQDIWIRRKLVRGDLESFTGSYYGADFSKLDLSFHRFYKCNLEAVNFSGANLEHAEFYYCNLKRVNLASVKMRGTLFHGCNVSGMGNKLRIAMLRLWEIFR